MFEWATMQNINTDDGASLHVVQCRSGLAVTCLTAVW